MKKEQWFAIVTGLIMLSSILGFGFAYMGIADEPANDASPINTITSNIINRQLDQQEISAILRSGAVIIEYYYMQGCEDCAEVSAELEAFANRFPRFVFLTQVEIEPLSSEDGPELEEKFRILTGQGRIVNLDSGEVTSDYLLENFCQVAAVQPAECVLMQI